MVYAITCIIWPSSFHLWRRNAEREAQAEEAPIDVLLTAEWPRGMEDRRVAGTVARLEPTAGRKPKVLSIWEGRMQALEAHLGGPVL